MIAAEARTEPPKYAYVDALRGIAIAMVAAVHTAYWGHPWLNTVINMGGRGVQLFYVLSAFTLCLSLHSRVGRTREPHPDLGFFVRRFFRIAPLFYLVVAGVMVAFPQPVLTEMKWWITAPTYREVLLLFTFTNGFDPAMANRIIGGWSIAVEMQFYLLIPLLFLWVRSFRAASLLSLGSWAAYTAWGVWFRMDFSRYFFLLPSQISVFLAGLALFHLVKDRAEGRGNTWRTAAISVFLLSYLAVRLGLTDIVPEQAWNADVVAWAWGFVLLAYGLSIHPWRVLVNPVTVFLGRVSYSFYLLHFYVIYGLEVTGTVEWLRWGIPQFLLRYVLLFAVTLPLSYVCYRVVELPGQEFGRWMLRRFCQREPVRPDDAGEGFRSPVVFTAMNGSALPPEVLRAGTVEPGG